MSRRGLRPRRRLGEIAGAAFEAVRRVPAEPLDAALELARAQLAELPNGGRADLTGRAIVLMEPCRCPICERGRSDWFLRR